MMIYAWHCKCQNWAGWEILPCAWVWHCPAPGASSCCSCCHNHFFCCPDFVVWPSPCSASAVERRGQYSGTIQRSCGLQFLCATGFRNCRLIRQALDLLLWHQHCSQAMKWAEEKNRFQGYDILPKFPDTSTAKKKNLSADVDVLARWISTAFFWKINSTGKCCGEQVLQHKLCCTIQRITSVSRQRNVCSWVISHSKKWEKPQLSWRYGLQQHIQQKMCRQTEKRILIFLLPTWFKSLMFFLIKLQLFKNI